MRYITREQLADIVKSDCTPGKDYLVVDVRDDDYAGGNIKGAKNVPSYGFASGVGALVKDTKDIPKIVFHCAYSQIRGPKAAKCYEGALGEKSDKEVVVLQGGFATFQAKYKDDPQLVENWDKAVWEETAWTV
ncbi:hypothetical protein AX14_004780 [Amanita brunnescens Koide BX004]|nr:hypothetical protein AX14_004780 [Amanita brunnescens Koide BX004]